MVSYLVNLFVSTIINLLDCRQSIATAGEKRQGWAVEATICPLQDTFTWYTTQRCIVSSVKSFFHFITNLMWVGCAEGTSIMQRVRQERQHGQSLVVSASIFLDRLKSLTDGNYHICQPVLLFSAHPRESTYFLLQHYGLSHKLLGRQKLEDPRIHTEWCNRGRKLISSSNNNDSLPTAICGKTYR